MVYRSKNVSAVEKLVTEVLDLPGGGDCLLWALDQPSESLSQWTRGAGPGPKFGLLDQLLDESNRALEDEILVADDDVLLEVGSLSRFIAIARCLRLDVAQPAHSSSSFWNHHITLVRPRVRARITNFVEIGPIFLLSPSAGRALLPFGPDVGMGWGLERIWRQTLSPLGMKLGIVDEVTMRHLVPAAADYDWQGAFAQQQALWVKRGYLDADEPSQTFRTWPWWRRLPSSNALTGRGEIV